MNPDSRDPQAHPEGARALVEAWLQTPGTRAPLSVVARTAGVPEAHLLGLAAGPDLVRLSIDPAGLARALGALGPLRAALPGPLGEHERELSVSAAARHSGGLHLHGDGARLHLRPERLGSAWAICRPGHPAGPRGFVLCDTAGDVALRVELGLRARPRAFSDAVAALRGVEQAPPALRPPPAPGPRAAVAHPSELQRGWARSTAQAERDGLIRAAGVDRGAAWRALAPAFATPLRPAGLRELVERIAADELCVRWRAGNRAATQQHEGTIERVWAPPGQIAVNDPGFSALIRPGAAAEAWVVRRPSDGGMRLSVELLGPRGELWLSLDSGGPGAQPWRWRRAVEHTLHAWRATLVG
jgi:putative heme degradation protein